MEMQDGSIRNTIILTTSFAAAGLAIAIVSYVFSSKWICCRGGPKSLIDILAKTSFMKEIKETESKLFNMVTCCNEGTKTESSRNNVLDDHEDRETEGSKNDEDIETERSRNNGFDEDIETEGSRSDGLDDREVLIKKEERDNNEFEEIEIEQITEDKGAAKAEVSVKQLRKGPLVSSRSLYNLVMFLYISSKVVLILSSVTYFLVARPIDDPSFSADQLLGMNISFYITVIGFSNEILGLLVTPIVLFICRMGWGVTLAKFGEYFRYYDLQIALMCSPFASVHLYYLAFGSVSAWIFIIIRTCVYSVTFASLIIFGFRFLLVTYCCKLKCCNIPCCSVAEAIEIKDWKYLFKNIGLHLLVLTIKLTTGSSALATFFKIGVLQSAPVKFAYLIFALLSCFNAISSVFYNTVLLRWRVIKEENKNDGSYETALQFLKVKAPSAHISFAITACINCGLIVLNAYILKYGNLQ